MHRAGHRVGGEHEGARSGVSGAEAWHANRAMPSPPARTAYPATRSEATVACARPHGPRRGVFPTMKLCVRQHVASSCGARAGRTRPAFAMARPATRTRWGGSLSRVADLELLALASARTSLATM